MLLVGQKAVTFRFHVNPSQPENSNVRDEKFRWTTHNKTGNSMENNRLFTRNKSVTT